jgi:hypothetical protein
VISERLEYLQEARVLVFERPAFLPKSQWITAGR